MSDTPRTTRLVITYVGFDAIFHNMLNNIFGTESHSFVYSGKINETELVYRFCNQEEAQIAISQLIDRNISNVRFKVEYE